MTDALPPPKAGTVGLHAGIPFDDYADAPGLSISRLKMIEDSPARARFGEFKETASMRAGTLLHTTLLEPHALEVRYMGVDLNRRGTKAWKALEEKAEAEGKTIVKLEELDTARRQRDALLRHPVAGQILTPAMAVEQSMWWRDEETGLLLRGRADGVRRDLRCLVDAKTAQSASQQGFTQAVRRYRYDWQDAHYREGMREVEGWYPDTFVFVVVEPSVPHLVACYELDDATVSKAHEKIADARRQWLRCTREEEAGTSPDEAWPGYPATLTSISLENSEYE